MYGIQEVLCRRCDKWFKIPFINLDFSLDLSIKEESAYFKCPDCGYENSKNIYDGLIEEVQASGFKRFTENTFKPSYSRKDFDIPYTLQWLNENLHINVNNDSFRNQWSCQYHVEINNDDDIQFVNNNDGSRYTWTTAVNDTTICTTHIGDSARRQWTYGWDAPAGTFATAGTTTTIV